MDDAVAGLRAELGSLAVARREFPIWTDWGVLDESHAMHSLGLSYLVTVGQSLGYVAVCEYPVAGHRIRADAVWWDRETRAPVAVFEFERHKEGTELVAKVRNLMRAWHETDRKPALLGLVFWGKRFYATGDGVVGGLWHEPQRGFRDDDRSEIGPIPAHTLHIFECLHSEVPGGRHTLKRFKEWRGQP